MRFLIVAVLVLSSAECSARLVKDTAHNNHTNHSIWLNKCVEFDVTNEHSGNRTSLPALRL